MDKRVQKKLRDQIALECNNMIRNKLRTGQKKGFPLFVQVELAELMAEGKRACHFSSIPFKHWVKESIKHIGYEQCNLLARAGASTNVKAALQKQKAYNTKINNRYRKRKKAAEKDSKDVKKRFDKLPKEHKKEFLRDLSEEFPPFDGYDDEAAELIESIERGLQDEQ